MVWQSESAVRIGASVCGVAKWGCAVAKWEIGMFLRGKVVWLSRGESVMWLSSEHMVWLSWCVVCKYEVWLIECMV